MWDIVIFGCCAGMFFICFGFLLYEWLLSKKKRAEKNDKKHKFVLPAAEKIYWIMQKKFQPELKEEVLVRYRKLYVGKSDESIRDAYYLKHISLFLYMFMLCQILLLSALFICRQDFELISGYYIEKNDIGGEQKEIKLKTKADGFTKEMDILVPERKYSQDEIKIQAKKVKRYIYEHYLGENKSADKIYKNLNLMKKIKGSMFVISWASDNEKVVSSDGQIYGKKLDDRQQVGLTAVIKYDMYKEKLKFNVTVNPIKKSREESIWEEWNKSFSNAVEKTKSLKYLKLPEKIAGKKIRYKVNRYETLGRLAALMLLMFLTVPYMVETISKSKVSDREKQLKIAYPEMIEKFVLLVNAGLPVKNAWIRIAETENENKEGCNYLKEEMLLTKRQMENGISEEKAYEMFGRRIGLLTYMKFCTLLVQNLKKGTADMIKILEYESADVFNERKENAKILGEEAGTKLLIPMMTMMIIIFAIILYAAFAGM